jgi:hypothetical protein
MLGETVVVSNDSGGRTGGCCTGVGFVDRDKTDDTMLDIATLSGTDDTGVRTFFGAGGGGTRGGPRADSIDSLFAALLVCGFLSGCGDVGGSVGGALTPVLGSNKGIVGGATLGGPRETDSALALPGGGRSGIGGTMVGRRLFTTTAGVSSTPTAIGGGGGAKDGGPELAGLAAGVGRNLLGGGADGTPGKDMDWLDGEASLD